MKLIINRFEGDYAVCEAEERKMINIPRRKLPSEAKEGDVLNVVGDHITVNISKTLERKKYIEELTKDLWE